MRGQESFSFVIAISAALIIFLLMIPLIEYDTKSSVIINNFLKADSIIERLSDAIVRSYLSGNGTNEYISLHGDIEFNVTIVPRYIVIYFNNETKSKHVIASNISQGIFEPGEYLISNKEGFINVTKIT